MTNMSLFTLGGELDAYREALEIEIAICGRAAESAAAAGYAAIQAEAAAQARAAALELERIDARR